MKMTLWKIGNSHAYLEFALKSFQWFKFFGKFLKQTLCNALTLCHWANERSLTRYSPKVHLLQRRADNVITSASIQVGDYVILSTDSLSISSRTAINKLDMTCTALHAIRHRHCHYRLLLFDDLSCSPPPPSRWLCVCLSLPLSL